MQALGTAVLILPDTQPERTASGRIIIPGTTKELAPEEGTVVQCGPACDVVKKGDRVRFPRKTSSIAEIEGITHYFTSEHKIFIIL
jgi:co-chaperonin GroES (HSP10)